MEPLTSTTVMKKQSSHTSKPDFSRGQAQRATLIKLGLDIHADHYAVARQVDGATPQPPQKFTPPSFLEWAAKQLELAQEVWSCCEAGPFGYGLHRQLASLGVKNLVARPRNWDDYGQRVKTDKRDARQPLTGEPARQSANTLRSGAAPALTPGPNPARSKDGARPAPLAIGLDKPTGTTDTRRADSRLSPPKGGPLPAQGRRLNKCPHPNAR